jgi:hypothetical protein
LKSISLPGSLEFLDTEAFSGCSNLGYLSLNSTSILRQIAATFGTDPIQITEVLEFDVYLEEEENDFDLDVFLVVRDIDTNVRIALSNLCNFDIESEDNFYPDCLGLF